MHIFPAGFRASSMPYGMFDLEVAAETARRNHKLRNIYHRGQDLAWDGRKVLAELVERHGGVDLPEDKRRALQRIFAIILWGELAAWKISAQLADNLVSLEAKMAATSQAHDEARHFYVMYDYLKLLGEVPNEVTRPTRAILDLVLETDSMLEKLTGMQLLVETLALTIFQLVREARAEPVLCDLLRFFEKDEARHVGLGIQHLPDMMKQASRLESARAVAFQLKIVGWTLRGLHELEPDLTVLGISPRRVIQVGRNKMFTATEMLWSGAGGRPLARQKLEAGIDSLVEVLFPVGGRQTPLRKRLGRARRVWRQGGIKTEMVDLAGS